MISFVYYFHSRRTENLKQSLRMLFKREKCIGEVILVCNDRTEEKFENCIVYNMDMENYEKPKMCNFGVSKASNEIITILDSDRILPEGYFSEITSRIKSGLFFSCSRLLALDKPYSDEEINNENFKYKLEIKSTKWDLYRKNLFSGNTTFLKKDYISVGGMDENFIGYGFADNDMTMNVISKGMKAIWIEENEIHLYHDRETMEKKELVGEDVYKNTSRKNMIRFLRKWNLTNHREHYYYKIL